MIVKLSDSRKRGVIGILFKFVKFVVNATTYVLSQTIFEQPNTHAHTFLCIFVSCEAKRRDQESGFVTKPLGGVSLFWGSNTHFPSARSGKCGIIQYVSQSQSANHPSRLPWRHFPQIERRWRWEATFTACQKLSVII